MRTRWLVLLVLVAACQTSGGGRSGAIVWHAPARTPVLERKDAGENATPQQRQVRITVGDAVRESLAAGPPSTTAPTKSEGRGQGRCRSDGSPPSRDIEARLTRAIRWLSAGRG